MSYIENFTKNSLPWANNQESELVKIKKQYVNSIRTIVDNSDKFKRPTKREVEVYEMWRNGFKYDEIATILGIEKKTAKELKYRYQNKLKINAEFLKVHQI